MNPPRGAVAITAWSLYLPDVDVAAVLPELAAAAPSRVAAATPAPALASQVLGRRGLLNKEPATRLALCAVHRALGMPDGQGARTGSPDPRVAVVASSNGANFETVIGIVGDVRAGGRHAVSPVAAPNASPNALASAVAIWFRFGGPNLMLCSGRTSGLDALALAALLLRAGRADRVVVIGAEPADEVGIALYAQAGPGPPPVPVGACVVLEPATAAPGAARLGPIRSVAERPAPATVDLTTHCGDLYGASGVAQAAVAAGLCTGSTAPVRPLRLVCGDPTEGWRVAEVFAPMSPQLTTVDVERAGPAATAEARQLDA